MCNFCNSRTSATQQEHISQCPEVLTVVLLRNADNEDNIAAHFPLERVCPSTVEEQQEEIAKKYNLKPADDIPASYSRDLSSIKQQLKRDIANC